MLIMNIRKRLIAAVISAAMCLSFMTACGDSDDSSASGPTPAPDGSSAADSSDADTSGDSSDAEKEEVTPIDVTQGATEEMLERAYIYNGDLSRLAAVIKDAQDGGTTNICYFGDSISAGSGVVKGDPYSNLFYLWWRENISKRVLMQNASIGATDSYLAVHRFKSDVAELDFNSNTEEIENAHLIIIEYINDENTLFYKETMDSLVRMALSLPSNPAVIILMPTCDNGASPQDQHLEVAKHYNVPMISYHDAVMPEVEKGSFEWSDISNDTVHPNDAGHAMIAQMLEGLVSYTIENMDTIGTDVTPFDPATESLTGDKYANADKTGRDRPLDNVVCVDEGSFTDINASLWPFTSCGYTTYSGGSSTWEITAKNIGMCYMKTTDGKSGVAIINVDGEDVARIDADFTGGWGNFAKIASVYEGDEEATHTVTVTIEDGDADDFTIFYWLIS